MKKKQAAEKPDRHKKKGKTKPGLTFVERRRLAELKHMLAGTNKNAEKPTTAQKTITFQKMYRDGICQVTSGFYTKMVEFYDINYDLLEIEDKGEILEEYSRLINYFDPSIKFELFLFNRQVNEQTLIDQFDIPLQADDFDDIREEYTQMLKKQAAKGNNGIIKSKYLIFGIESKGFKEARAKLVSIEADVIKNLTNLGTHAKSLDGKERLRILHEYFNQDTMEPFRFSFKELAESGKSVKDYIAPPGFDFRYPSRFKAGKMYGSVHYLDIIAPKFDDELLKKLLDLDANLTIIALAYIEIELQHHPVRNLSEERKEIAAYISKALSFIRKMQKFLATPQVPPLISANNATENTASLLQWTGNAIDLVELIYGIDEMGCINNGNMPLKQLAPLLYKIFGVESKDCYRFYTDIKRRKNESRTYFLDRMQEKLNERMMRDEELEIKRR